MTKHRDDEVIIVGASIAGLMQAIALAKIGITATGLERSSQQVDEELLLQCIKALHRTI